MTSPSSLNFSKELSVQLGDSNYDIFKSPIGYVVTYKQFQAFIDESTNQFQQVVDLSSEKNELIQKQTREFEETIEHISSNHKQSVKRITNEGLWTKIAMVVAVIVSCALAILLLVVLI